MLIVILDTIFPLNISFLPKDFVFDNLFNAQIRSIINLINLTPQLECLEVYFLLLIALKPLYKFDTQHFPC